ncbi:hypothetical protein [Pseudonocardia sp. TRM90224]|uniref:hypothetical protein n=1 Tax=Pseudonocardia sp. TRM90224 TaxID=2812678 RepID=UPI001E3BA330|nr:hypothetical protein [Pseudonocardia sp. TRM90224]
MMNLDALLDITGLDVLDHLDRQVAVPVVDGLQAQGDLIVIPAGMTPTVTTWPSSRWRPLPAEGLELVRGIAGNNPHTLVAEPGTCELTPDVEDPLRLAIAMFTNTAPAYLIHPEHGGTGIAPGRWLVRRQRERGNSRGRGTGVVLVAD